MEKLEEQRRDAQTKLSRMQSDGFVKDEPVSLSDYRLFLKAISDLLKSDQNLKFRIKVIRFLVHKIQIIPEGFEVHFKVGESYVKIFLVKYEELRKGDKSEKAVANTESNIINKSALPDFSSGNAAYFSGHFSSNTCYFGAQDKT